MDFISRTPGHKELLRVLSQRCDQKTHLGKKFVIAVHWRKNKPKQDKIIKQGVSQNPVVIMQGGEG